MKKPDFKIADVPSSVFSYHARDRVLVSEMSTLEANAQFTRKIISRVYNDACDEGFWVTSSRTGRKVLFVLDNIAHDREGDVQVWEFAPAEECGINSITVFND